MSGRHLRTYERKNGDQEQVSVSEEVFGENTCEEEEDQMDVDNNTKNQANNPEEEEDEGEDEEIAVLQRLSNNYRRFSEARTRSETVSDDHHEIEAQEDGIEQGRPYSYGDEEEDEEEASQNEGDERMQAMEMLASALFGSGTRILRRSEHTAAVGSDAPTESNNSESLHDSSRSQATPSNTMERMMMNSFFGNISTNQGEGYRLSELIKELKTQEDPFLVMEILNEVSSLLLMMSSIISERLISTFQTARVLIDVLNKFPLDMEIQLVACRCIYNLAEVNFYSIGEIVSAGAIEKLNAILLDISYMELAEQALQTLEIISKKCGHAIITKHSIPAVIGFLDFFTIHAQRKSLNILANASEYIKEEIVEDVKNAFGTVQNVAIYYSDTECLESSWMFIYNTLLWFRNKPDILKSFANDELVKKMLSVVVSGLRNSSAINNINNRKIILKIANALLILSSQIPSVSLLLLKNDDLSSFFAGNPEIKKNDIIDTILACPKDLLNAFLKVIASALPSISGKSKETIDFGFYIGTAASDSVNEIDNKRLLLYREEDAQNKFYTKFASVLFPTLLSIFSSTVEFKQRRLVLLVVIRVVKFLNKQDLESVVLPSKLTDAIVPPLIKGEIVLNSTEPCLSALKNYCIIYGCLLVSQILVTKNPSIFFNDFSREGLISYLEKQHEILTNTKEMISNSPFDNVIDEIEAENENDSFEESEYDNDEIDFTEEEEEEEEDEDGDEELHLRSNYRNPNGRSSHISGDPCVTNDGLYPLSLSKWINELLVTTDEILSEYQSFSAMHTADKPEHVSSLNSLINFLDSIIKNSNLISSAEEWEGKWVLLTKSLLGNDSEKLLSSYELVSSGLIPKLTKVLVTSNRARESFSKLFCSVNRIYNSGEKLPVVQLVDLLNDALDRSEAFEILASDLAQTDNNTKFKAQSIAKQMKIKITVENHSVDENVDHGGRSSNAKLETKKLIVMVQAIATFESLDSFIKRTAGRFLNLEDNSLDNSYHYEFYLNDEIVPLDTTVFGASYNLLQNTAGENVSISSVFKYPMIEVIAKRVEGEREQLELLLPYFHMNQVSDFCDETTLHILTLLKTLHDINLNSSYSGINDALFLNYKLTAKLNRQLEEPLVVASGILPEWAISLPRYYSFMFPLDTRIFFIKSTSFGYSRLMSLWANKAKEQERNSRMPLGRPVRHKLRIARDTMFLGAMKIMENFGSKPGLIEIEYYDEAGSGLGPTLEFYANVSKEFGKTKLYLWRCDSYGKSKQRAFEKTSKNMSEVYEYVRSPNGLFPRPLPSNISEKSKKKILNMFKFLGRFLARSFLDSRIVDFRFNPMFFKLAVDISKLKDNKVLSTNEKMKILMKVDPDLSKSLQQLLKFKDGENSKENILTLALEYVLPGYPDYVLKEGGHEIDITKANLSKYVDDVLNATLFNGIEMQINAFIEGFSEVLPFNSLMLFSPDEFVRLFGNETEDWSFETLLPVIHADHGYNNESQQIKWLVEILASFHDDYRRKFLQFLTGSPRLPIGGFKSLSPPVTVVLKHTDDGFKSDDYLPSVMTCANYLKLPNYSSPDVMRTKLVQAMEEGANAFLLS